MTGLLLLGFEVGRSYKKLLSFDFIIYQRYYKVNRRTVTKKKQCCNHFRAENYLAKIFLYTFLRVGIALVIMLYFKGSITSVNSPAYSRNMGLK